MSEVLRSPLADFYLAQGATLGEYHGAIVPARFSDPRLEHEAVRKAAGVFDFSFRAKFALKGDDRVNFLQGMVSNDVRSLAPGQGTYALLLNAHGHILADARIYSEKGRFLLDTDADLRDKVMKIFDHYIIMDQVEQEPLALFTLGFHGPRARPLLEKTLGIDLPPLSEFGHFSTNYAGFPLRVVRASVTGEEGYEVWVPAAGMMGVWGAACGQAPAYDMLPGGTEALETLRLEAGIPRYGEDLDEYTLPLEAGLENALSFTKGCYVGQEVVERTRSRGHVNWKLVGVFVDAAAAPPTGEKLLFEGKEIGEISSACASPSLSRTIALAYVRREVSEAGTKLALASGPAAEVTPLPFYRRAQLEEREATPTES
jgi:glycine cleavage system T protein